MSAGNLPLTCCLAGWTLLNLCINTFNDFFKNNVNLGASFVMRAGDTCEVFCADIASADGRVLLMSYPNEFCDRTRKIYFDHQKAVKPFFIYF
jgi:hypothetical protein